jgi:hypothetical protein
MIPIAPNSSINWIGVLVIASWQEFCRRRSPVSGLLWGPPSTQGEGEPADQSRPSNVEQ